MRSSTSRLSALILIAIATAFVGCVAGSSSPVEDEATAASSDAVGWDTVKGSYKATTPIEPLGEYSELVLETATDASGRHEFFAISSTKPLKRTSGVYLVSGNRLTLRLTTGAVRTYTWTKTSDKLTLVRSFPSATQTFHVDAPFCDSVADCLAEGLTTPACPTSATSTWSCSANHCTFPHGTPMPETCNGIDENCDGVADDHLVFASCGVGTCHRVGTTCNPSSCTPGMPSAEICNGADDNCNGVIDDGVTCPVPSHCPHAPSPETCNGIDDDCDGHVDNGIPMSVCGVGACAAVGTTCFPASCTIHNGMPEVPCNAIDDNCNGLIDEGSTCPKK